MQMQPVAIVNRNRELKGEVGALGLRLEDVFQPAPQNPGRENRILEELLRWARAYLACPNRRELERQGFHFPPVSPDYDPDTDWMRFERWINREPVSWNFVQAYGSVARPNDLMPDQVSAELNRVTSLLRRRGVIVGVSEAIPQRLLLQFLHDYLQTARFDIGAPDTHWHIDGCDGCCPECFQRPWCEPGRSSCWPADEAAGEMVIPDAVLPYVATRRSVAELRDAEAGGW